MTLSLHRVVVGTDRSAASIRAGSWAAEHIDSDGALVSVLAVSPWVELLVAAAQVDPDRLYAHWADNPEELGLSGLADGVALSHRLVHDAPAAALLDQAAKHRADAIVIGKQGHRGHRHFGLGPVVRRLLHHVDRPVVLIPEDGEPGNGRIVVGIDGSPHSRNVLTWVAAHVTERARVDVRMFVEGLFSIPELTAFGAGVTMAELQLQTISDQAVLASARDEVAALVDSISFPAETTVTATAEFSVAWDGLIDAAGAASVLVLGTHGHGGLHGLPMLGSTVTEAAHRTSVPMIVVPN